MPDINITPADSPDVMCVFTVPRAGKSDLVFTVPRVEYSHNYEARWTKWLGERMRGSETEDGQTVEPEPITDSEGIVEQLRLAGNLSAATVKQIYALTPGELSQIFEAWTAASKTSVGESAASDS